MAYWDDIPLHDGNGDEVDNFELAQDLAASTVGMAERLGFDALDEDENEDDS